MVFRRAVAFSFFCNYVNDDRTVHILYHIQNVLKTFFIVTVKRTYVLKTEVGKQII